jgi:hypothetical protein
MTRSILDVLATLPSGAAGSSLSFDELGLYLQKHYNNECDRDRAKRHALREELYRDGGVHAMKALIDRVFQDPTVRELRKQMVPLARFANPTKRLVHELATVYTEPAHREVDNATNATYQTLLDTVRMEERAVEISRLLNLHRALIVGFRVRVLPDGTREPVLDIASAANARAITHPNDNTLVIGWMIRTCYKSARPSVNDPAWTLWTDHESIQLRDDMTPIGDTYNEHGFGVCPWVGVTLGPPAPGFFPGDEGEDLVSAHLTIWLAHVLLIKETKSATKQSVLQGDGTAAARGQVADTEVPAELPEGVAVTTVDMSVDLSMYRDTATHSLDMTALNYGIPPAVLNRDGTQSAEARELQRIPIKQLTRQQQVPLRRFEMRLAIVMAAVLRVDMPDLAFDPSNFRVEFSESETPLDPQGEHNLFIARRDAGLDNSVDFIKRRHPGMTDEQAIEKLDANIRIERGREALAGPSPAPTPSATPPKPSADLTVAAQPVSP